ncbi:MAG: VWA domain-containing protein [Armatimonadetes bacterium]|nr:VWA domain-containing protein [Armatimonadota bacterium]MBS1710120.1 VWA domain-containing protein [Armatimonadota bacterium]MBX3110010.1 VWA domain-containing protein [Fimbriimonadaceae bacterium]
MNQNDPNRTIISPPLDPNRTVVGGPSFGGNQTMAMSAPPMAGDPNRTAAFAPASPLKFVLTPTREATMANGPAREQFLLEITAPTDGGLPGMSMSGDRAPLNLCLVIDRSGSMEGQPMDYAKQACNQLVDLLSANDVLSIVVFDEIVEVLMTPQRVTDKQAIKNGIAQLQPGYTTNLYDGMTLGSQQLGQAIESGRVTRMVVLTDGEPTAGIKDFQPLVAHSGEIKDKGITTTFLGFGQEYNEELLASMAKRSGGNYYYIPRPELIPEIFRTEFNKMVSTTGVNLRLDLKTARWVKLKGVTGHTGAIDREISVNLADIEKGSTIEVVCDFEFENHPLGWYRVASGKLSYDSVTGGTQTVDVDFVMEFTADSARYMAAPNPKVDAAWQVSAASRVVEKTIMGLKTQAITSQAALADLAKTQALLTSQGKKADAQEVTMAMQAIQRGDIGGAEKTLMGTMVKLDQGKSQ